jgi:hypothetical protein
MKINIGRRRRVPAADLPVPWRDPDYDIRVLQAGCGRPGVGNALRYKDALLRGRPVLEQPRRLTGWGWSLSCRPGSWCTTTPPRVPRRSAAPSWVTPRARGRIRAATGLAIGQGQHGELVHWLPTSLAGSSAGAPQPLPLSTLISNHLRQPSATGLVFQHSIRTVTFRPTAVGAVAVLLAVAALPAGPRVAWLVFAAGGAVLCVVDLRWSARCWSRLWPCSAGPTSSLWPG